MTFTESNIPGCYLIDCFHQEDGRGSFTKWFHRDHFMKEAGGFKIAETYFSWSEPGVFRGFHFQQPPHDHTKLVVCASGAVQDYVVDLRPGSGYGKVLQFQLDAKLPQALLIPKGCGHGFYVPERESLLLYMVETTYAPEYDSGILWSSLDYAFPFSNPVVSERDGAFPGMEEFESPFSGQ